MKFIRILFFILCFWQGLDLVAAETNVPVIEFLNKSAHISSAGALPGWDVGFRKKFDSDFEYMVNQLNSDLADVKMEGEGGGKTNFEVKISIILMYDCHPCKGENAVSEESLFATLTIIDPSVNRQIVDKFYTDTTHFVINGEPDVQETVNRTWSQFLLTFIKDEQLKEIIKRITYIQDATLLFRPKDGADEKPLKADGKKRGILKISEIKTGMADYPVGENDNNPLTEFELSCENGLLVDEDGSEVKKIKFKGSEYVNKRDNFEFDYVVYNCDDNCDKYDVFSLKLKSQNGEDLVREVATKKEEFACYGYTISLEYSETNELTGTTKISATWDCVKIDFGKPGKEPVELDMNASMTGEAMDTNGDPLLPPYTIPMAIENGLIHVSAPIKNNMPASYSFSSTGGAWHEFAASFKINFDEDYLTNPPELIWVKSSVAAEELCGGVIPAGVYLEWQFDIWGDLPELGYSQLYQPAATKCLLLTNVANSTLARVPENVIPLMKDGKAFSFTNSNDFGTYTITGIPKQQ